MTTKAMLIDAIQKEYCVTFTYHNHIRHFSPHAIGTDLNSTKVKVFGMQYDGSSSNGLSSNMEENWRCFYIDEIINIKVNKDAFSTAKNHSKRQTCIEILDEEIYY